MHNTVGSILFELVCFKVMFHLVQALSSITSDARFKQEKAIRRSLFGLICRVKDRLTAQMAEWYRAVVGNHRAAARCRSV